MIFEVYVSSFGVIGIGGVIAFILGSILLFDTHDANYQLAWSLVIAMSVVTAAFIFIIMTLAIRSHKKAIVTGQEGLIDSEGIVLSVMNEQITVRVLGEIWEARSSHSLKTGEKVKVTAVKGLLLNVEPTGSIGKSGEE
jgi:membrane-bound serine protease (ClpP class)